MGELILTTLLIGVAAYRVWRIAARDQITEPLRHPIVARSDRPVWGWWWDLIDCPWCLGFWVTGVLTVVVDVWVLPLNTAEGGLVWFAASTVCGLLGRLDQ